MNINLMGYLSTLGYGNVTLNILRELTEQNHRVALFPIGGVSNDIPQYFHSYIQKGLNEAKLFDRDASCVRISVQSSMAEWVGTGQRIAFPFFELDDFTELEVHHINQADEIFVPSEWARNIVKQSGYFDGVPIHVVPCGVDRNIFHENLPKRISDYTQFIQVGKFELRKGHDVLLEAFNKAFEPSDKVGLTLVSINPFIGDGNDAWKKEFQFSKMGRNIKIPGRLTDQQNLAKVMADSDAGVFPSRAEGWNLDLLEAMSVGLPTIATNYSGHTEYVTRENCRIVDVDSLEIANDGVFFDGTGGSWACLGGKQVDQLVFHLREIHKLKQTGRLQRNEAGIETAKQFSWTNSANKFIQGLTDV